MNILENAYIIEYALIYLNIPENIPEYNLISINLNIPENIKFEYN